MSNIATVQGIYEAFGKGDVPAILAVLADDVAWEDWPDNSSVNAGVPWMVPRRGKDDVVHFFEAVAQMELIDVQVLGGESVFVLWADKHETILLVEELRDLCRCARCVGEPEYPISGR